MFHDQRTATAAVVVMMYNYLHSQYFGTSYNQNVCCINIILVEISTGDNWGINAAGVVKAQAVLYNPIYLYNIIPPFYIDLSEDVKIFSHQR